MNRRILYLQYANPAAYPPIQHSSCLLAEEGWEVFLLGAGTPGADALEFPAHPNITIRRTPACRPGWRQKINYLGFAMRAWAQALRMRPSWIYASDPLSGPVALGLSFVGWRVVYHEHDSPRRAPESMETSLQLSETFFMRLVLWTRERLACRARLCVLPNAARVRKLQEETGRTQATCCVWNCATRAEARETTNCRADDRMVLFYHGSIVPARLPLAVITALAKLPETVILRVAGYETIGHPGYVEQLYNRAVELGARRQLEFIGALSRSALLPECRRADVGLSFMPLDSDDVNEQEMTGASNKAFDYLACGLPLLVSDRPDWRRMYVDPGYGRACHPEESDSIAETLRWYLAHPDERRDMGERGRNRIIQEWNYETQFAPVRSLLMTPA